METLIIVPISRANFLKQFFASLEALECDVEKTGLFVYIDGDLNLFEKAQRFVAQSKFTKRWCVFRGKGLPNVGSVKRRRQRIADIHNEIKTKIPESKYIFLTEDDTLLPPSALQTLLDHYQIYRYAGFISGVQIGRWGFPIIGALEKEQGIITSVPPGEHLKRVSAAGLYCCLMKAGSYEGHEFETFGKILGPDVYLGVSLENSGLRNYIDYDIKCTHLTQKEPITFDAVTPIQLRFTRDETNQFGWRQEVI